MLYHTDLGFPSTFSPPRGTRPVTLSRHARDREQVKGFTVPTMLDVSLCDVIEIEVRGGRVVKYVVRGAYDDYNDLVIVVIPKGKAWFVKTAWLNAWNDTHTTLDASKYGRS